MILALISISIIAVEIYKSIIGNDCWDNCYSKNKIYSYSDFIKYDLIVFNVSTSFCFIIFCLGFYIILILNIIFTLIIIVVRIIKPIEIKNKGKIFNIFIYQPYLISLVSKKVIRNKKIIKIIFINKINIVLWFFPRVVLNHSFTSIKILNSYKKNPENLKKKDIFEIFEYIYQETYGKNISKIEKQMIIP